MHRDIKTIVEQQSPRHNFMSLVTRHKAISSLLFFILLLTPNFITRLIAVSGMIIYLINKNNEIKKQTTFITLLLVFLFAYVFSPYWNVPESIPLKLISLIILLTIGIFWAKHAAHEIRINFKLKDITYLAILTALLLIVNYNNLTTDISWRGDEDHHISGVFNVLVEPLTGGLQEINNLFIIIASIVIIAALALYFRYHKRLDTTQTIRNTIYGLIVFSIGYLVTLLFTNANILNKPMETIVRYPFLLKWMMAFFVFPAKYAVPLYRFVPFLSIVLLSWFLYAQIKKRIHDKRLSVLLSFALTTIPILFFYSSILYLEMPIVLLMTIVLFDIQALIISDVKELFTRPTWYCLLLVSFLKEIAIIILALFILIRLLYQQLNKKLIEINDHSEVLLKKERIIDELRAYIILLLPVGIYLSFRIFSYHSRPYGMQVLNVINPFSYSVLLQALFNQFGMVLLIALIGLVLGLVSKNRIKYAIATIFFIGLSLFFIADKTVYIGYSRWNLLLVPMILLFSLRTIGNLKTNYSRMIIPAILIVAILLSNIFLAPTYRDGVKKPNWGSPLIDTAEHTYPYDKTFEWLQNNGEIKHLLITGYNYRGYSEFYLKKHGFDLDELQLTKLIPKEIKYEFFNETRERELLNEILKEVENSYTTPNKQAFIFFDRTPIQDISTVDTIVYFSLNNIELEESMILLNTFKVEKKIANRENSIYIIRPLER